ncbi:hypothetical protein WICPIJ_007369 [Wickerhamomyces pijperi]|uniref:GYF domain-containing protein n=1 Tax=Wickerhamomyces pijperi TaxID=599730 RepID=A0A9P8Q013_WICPI|nr:hypothetical protein WICPIJ_007369 [Wickerhamomyces pijperi]
MRPKTSRHSSQDASSRSNSNLNQSWEPSATNSSNSNVQLNEQASHITNSIFNSINGGSNEQHQSSSFTHSDSFNSASKSNKVYSIDELTQIWSSIQDELQKKGYDEKYRSLAPIRQLIDQVENDRQVQKLFQQQQQQQQQQQNGFKRTDSSAQVSQLNDQLNEFGNWAKTESSLDFASILSKVSSSSNIMNSNIGLKSNSPFASKPMLHRDTSFQSIHSPLLTHNSLSQSNFHPQSTPSQQQPQLQLPDPAQVMWYYLDSNQDQHGPFAGDVMQSWYIGGYFAPNLHLRRADDLNFTTLEEFMILVNNRETPFLTPVPTTNNQPMAAPIATTPSFSSFAQFDGLSSQPMYQSSSTFITPQLQQTQQSGWANQSGRASPWASNNHLHDHNVNEFRLGSNSPFLSNSSTFVNDNSSSLLQQQSTFGSVIQQPLASFGQDAALLERINSQIFDDSYAETGQTVDSTKESAASPAAGPASAPAASLAKEAVHSTPKAQVSAPVATVPTSTPSSMQEALAEAKEAAKAEVKSARAPASRTLLTKPRTEKKEVKKLVTEASKSETEPTNVKPQLAPWASVTKTTISNDKPQLTLEQIQQMEAKESAKQLKIKAEKDKILASQLFAAAEREAELANQKLASLPVTSSWGKPVVKTVTPTKSLLDIQREEAEAEAKAAAAAAAKSASSNNNSNIPLAAAPPKSSFASIATPQNSNPWTTVTVKKPAPVKPVVKAPITSSAKINPDVLRSVSASNVQPASSSASSSTSRVSPRQEFLTWCRTTMKLNRGINENEVLQILLMLPIGNESQEIIADTIYCNSTTMDGRRFAQEFLKRRKVVEDRINDGLSWNDALHMTVEDDNDGWDFQVVGKKNKRRN